MYFVLNTDSDAGFPSVVLTFLLSLHLVNKTEELVVEFIAQHAERWQYWFKKIGTFLSLSL